MEERELKEKVSDFTHQNLCKDVVQYNYMCEEVVRRLLRELYKVLYTVSTDST